ncbi:MAG: hypothetical protein JWM14_2778, partial [Chitinophagaceae bacterium]|nr:hypothetical protein [Chitinophagaceae bacterium]
MPPLPTGIAIGVWVLATTGYLSICFIGWYLLAAFNYGMNSGQLGRHRWLFPFECFAEEVVCYLPGGKQHRINFITQRIGDWEGFMVSGSAGKSWSYEEIREKGIHEEVFYGMVGSHFGFWSTTFLTFFGSPIILALNIAFFSLIAIIGGIVQLGLLVA